MMNYGSQRVSMGVQACLTVACAGACDREDLEPSAEVSPRDLADNGLKLNSAVFNGWQLNGWQLNGWQLNGWQLNGWQLNGVTLSGSVFKGTKVVNGETVTIEGLDFIGAQIKLDGPDKKVTLRIDDIYKDPANPSGDVYFHKFSVSEPKNNGWTSLCRDAADLPTTAIVLANAWNMTTGARIDAPDAVTIACRGAALAKCVEFGYRPWATATSCVGNKCAPLALKDHHQACTRMVRADYCGTGTPHTLNGTPIDVIDRLSPVIQAEGTRDFANWSVEAEWGPGGALCVGGSLRLQMLGDLGVAYTYPTCIDDIDDVGGCGNFASNRGARLVNKYCADWTADPAACDGNADMD